MAGLAFRLGSPALADDPAVVGEWSPSFAFPIVSVHACLLPTGKVLSYTKPGTAYLWDPANPSQADALPSAGFNIFCSGHSQMPNGNVLITGGTLTKNGEGLKFATLFDPFNLTFTKIANMNAGRWYPTNVALANGTALTLSGSENANYKGNTLPQVWNGVKWKGLTTAIRALELYPYAHLAPNGKVLLSGPGTKTLYLDTAGTGAWSTLTERLTPNRSYGSSVLYDTGKVALIGGGDPPTSTVEVIDLNEASPSWRTLANTMLAPRRQQNSTLLPDGTILITGGTHLPGFDNGAGPIYRAELLDPALETFTALARAAEYRGYHSVALLLPDGRVWSAGGNGHKTFEIFSPPYLYKGSRPAIMSMPESGSYGAEIVVSTPDANSVTRVTLLRPGSVTHTVNMDQRILNASFTLGADSIMVTLPSDPNLCPPGYYMLFLLNGQGVPSEGKFIRIE